MEVKKLYDARDLGEFTEGKDLTLKIECIDEDGSEYYGWYYTVGTHHSGKKYNFFKTRLPNGKKCKRKVSSKIENILISIIKKNVDQKNYLGWGGYKYNDSR